MSEHGSSFDLREVLFLEFSVLGLHIHVAFSNEPSALSLISTDIIIKLHEMIILLSPLMDILILNIYMVRGL